MLSYLNDEKLKKDFVAEIKKHQKADRFLQGTYGEGEGKDFKGCAVGCSIFSLNKLHKKDYSYGAHEVYESELGLPEWLARLEDRIFEGLPVGKAREWPLRFSEAIPVGVDVNPIKWKFSAFLLSRNIERVLTLDISDELKEQVVDSIRGVLSVHESAIKTGDWDDSAAESARSATESARSAAESAWSAPWSAAESARSAAESAAWSATESARSAAESARSAAESARSATWSARSAAESAAWSAAWSAAESAAESAEYELYADKLIELLSEAK